MPRAGRISIARVDRRASLPHTVYIFTGNMPFFVSLQRHDYRLFIRHLHDVVSLLLGKMPYDISLRDAREAPRAAITWKFLNIAYA